MYPLRLDCKGFVKISRWHVLYCIVSPLIGPTYITNKICFCLSKSFIKLGQDCAPLIFKQSFCFFTQWFFYYLNDKRGKRIAKGFEHRLSLNLHCGCNCNQVFIGFCLRENVLIMHRGIFVFFFFS